MASLSSSALRLSFASPLRARAFPGLGRTASQTSLSHVSARQFSVAPTRATTTTTTTTINRFATTSIIPSSRFFSITASNSKKKSPSSSSSSSAAAPDDDAPSAGAFRAMQTEIDGSVTKLKEDIAQLRAGGRFNPATIEALKVKLRGSSSTTRLGDLAQVIPKGGRMVSVLVGDQEHTKAITSAICSSNLSLTAQPDPVNPDHQLNIPIPPPTKESREAAIKDARAALDKASLAVRNARGACNKKLKELEKKKALRPDEARKELDAMEKVAQKGQKDVKDIFETAKKGME